MWKSPKARHTVAGIYRFRKLSLHGAARRLQQGLGEPGKKREQGEGSQDSILTAT